MNKTRTSGFTLIELLLVMTIIGILTTLGISVAQSAEQDANEKRTRAGIERIANLLNGKLEENFYRVLPVRLDPNDVTTNPENIGDFRLRIMAEFLRIEFPTTIAQTDPANFPDPSAGGDFGGLPLDQYSPIFGPNDEDKPQIIHRYNAKLNENGTPSIENQEAECLYAILAISRDGHGSAFVETLRSREIGDTDGDGAKEVLDAFGDPLTFRLLDQNNVPIDPANPQKPQDYRFEILSINLSGANPSGPTTQ